MSALLRDRKHLLMEPLLLAQCKGDTKSVTYNKYNTFNARSWPTLSEQPGLMRRKRNVFRLISGMTRRRYTIWFPLCPGGLAQPPSDRARRRPAPNWPLLSTALAWPSRRRGAPRVPAQTYRAVRSQQLEHQHPGVAMETRHTLPRLLLRK